MSENVQFPEKSISTEDMASSNRFLSPDEISKEIEKLGLKTPSESVAMIRADRDSY